MATAIRPYTVKDNTTGAVRLVRAANQAAARSHVARDRFAVEVASANEVIDLMSAGIKVEDATPEPTTAPTQPAAQTQLTAQTPLIQD